MYTKLSLPVFVDIANVLSIRTDELLYDNPKVNKAVITDEIIELLNSCSANDMCIMADIIKAIKVTLDKHSDR